MSEIHQTLDRRASLYKLLYDELDCMPAELVGMIVEYDFYSKDGDDWKAAQDSFRIGSVRACRFYLGRDRSGREAILDDLSLSIVQRANVKEGCYIRYRDPFDGFCMSCTATSMREFSDETSVECEIVDGKNVGCPVVNDQIIEFSGVVDVSDPSRFLSEGKRRRETHWRGEYRIEEGCFIDSRLTGTNCTSINRKGPTRWDSFWGLFDRGLLQRGIEVAETRGGSLVTYTVRNGSESGQMSRRAFRDLCEQRAKRPVIDTKLGCDPVTKVFAILDAKE
jgi:hypothetical protein